jgi:hypothetical protein
MIIKTGSGVPTIPVSADHRNGDWIDTDIYEGEQYMDTDSGIMYTRNGSDILIVGSSVIKRAKILVSQSSTSAPTLIESENTIGTITPSRTSSGVYILTSTGNFPSGKTHVFLNAGSKNGYGRAWRVDNNTIRIETYNTSFVQNDSILDEVALSIEIYP